MQTFENFLLQNCSTEFLDIAQIVLDQVLLKFVQMVAGATYINNKLIAKANLNVTSNCIGNL